MTYISRDPFARSELHRFSEATTKDCDWCGSTRKTGKLFRYETHRDGSSNSPYRIKGLFCSIGCMRTYHDLKR